MIHFIVALDWWKDEISPNVEEVALKQFPLAYQNKSIAELQIIKKTGCNVIGYRDVKGKQYINPNANRSLSEAGKLIVLATKQNIKKLNTIFQLD